MVHIPQWSSRRIKNDKSCCIQHVSARVKRDVTSCRIWLINSGLTEAKPLDGPENSSCLYQGSRVRSHFTLQSLEECVRVQVMEPRGEGWAAPQNRFDEQNNSCVWSPRHSVFNRRWSRSTLTNIFIHMKIMQNPKAIHETHKNIVLFYYELFF